MPTAATATALPSARSVGSEVTAEHLRAYEADGFVVVRGLVGAERAATMRDHFMALRAQGAKPGDMGGDKTNAADPLNRYPRMINMHQWDQLSAAWAADASVAAAASALLRQGAVLNQTMLYFKPPGARGQALHQDQQYITIDPLIGAWCALDRCDRANGQMIVIPGSQRHGVLPVRPVDAASSFTSGGTVIPPGSRESGVDMEAGDVLFFSGATIHGSYANTTTDRFRRSFICHFIGDRATRFAPAPGTHMDHLAP
ncbi:MAG: phytanoyl-CoA dioxygenase family protein [Planctomycetes bacterium]|nr:phytanoyl-CoA dioxygenase family protein [Planctomycetota bacterium]